MSDVFLGLVDIANPPDDYEKYIWSCDGCVKGICWCIAHNKSYEVLPNPWEQEAKVDNAIVYLKSVREYILDALKKEIGEYLDVNYEDAEWFILLSTWLREFLTSCYDKYLRLQIIRGIGDAMDCYIYNTDIGAPQADNADYFQMSINNDSYNLLLYSELIYSMEECFRNVNFIKLPMDIIRMNTSHSQMTFLRRISRSVLNVMSDKLASISSNHIAINKESVSVKNKWILRWNNVKGVNIFPFFTQYEENKYNIIGTYVDQEWRNIPLALDYSADIFINLLKTVIKKEIPLAYVESHKSLKGYVEKKFDNILNACAYFSGASFVYDEVDRLILVMMREKGGFLCGCQHGANYGVEKCWVHEDEFQVYDRYFTWGWKKINESKRFFPKPSLFFMSYPAFPNSKSDLILYVTYSVPRYLSGFSRMEVNYKRTIKDGEIQFLKSLSSDVQSRIIVRLFPIDYGWNCREDLIHEIPDLQLDDNYRLHDTASIASLVITSDWQNVFIEMLANDKPVLVFCDGSYIMGEVLSDIQILQDVGIAHGSWDSLKKQIDEIDGKVQEWWKNPERQSVINKIKNKYAWMPENAEELWVEEFKELHREEKKAL